MKLVVSAADALVDNGESADAAIAKSARDHAMPVGHVPIVVRAFNTGRAVRQLGAEDPWEKAAAHPVASIDGVVAALTARPEPVKSASVLDYGVPPPGPAGIPRYIPPLVPPENKPKPPPPVEKRASAPEKPRDNRRDLEYAASAAFNRAVEIAADLNPRQYHAAKQAASRLYPEAAGYFFGAVESTYVEDDVVLPVHKGIAKSARAVVAIDPTVRNDHPLVVEIGRIDAAKKAYVVPEDEPVPDGYERVRGYGGISYFRKQAVCPIFGTPIVPVVEKKEAAAPTIESILQTPDCEKLAAGLNPFSSALQNYASNREGVSAIGRGFRGGFGVPMAAVFANPLIGQAFDHAPEDDKKFRAGAVGNLSADLDRVNIQSAAQDMLADPRFAKADPKILVDTYRDLRNLAPMAMSNRSVAADFIQRRLQTGQLSYWDLEKLTGIEKNLAQARRDANPTEDD